MRILHVADPHLDKRPREDRPDPATGIPSRTLDVGRAWIRAAEIGVERAVDLVIVAGDVFDGPNPTAVSENLFRDGLRILEAAGIRIVMIPGNHDRAPHPNHRSVLEIFDDRPNVYVSTKPEVLDVDGIRVATLPNVSPHQLMASHPEYSRGDAVAAMTEALVATLGMLRNEGADVLTGHWSVQGTILDNGRDMAQIGEAEVVIPQAELEGPWGYTAFGHIHQPQELKIGDSLFCYAGSIGRMNFGESHDPSVVIVTTGDDSRNAHGGTLVERVLLPARRFETIDVTPDWPDDYRGSAEPCEGTVYRLRVAGSMREHAPEIVRDLYRQGAHFVKVEVDNVRTIVPRSPAIADAEDPQEALDEWMERENVASIDRPVMRDMAKRLWEVLA